MTHIGPFQTLFHCHEFEFGTAVARLVFHTAISRKVVGKSARDNPGKALWVVLRSLFFKEI